MLTLKLSDVSMARLAACAANRVISPETLAIAYIEDWLNIEYAELKGRRSRRGLYRDGPIAFDPDAAAAAARIEEDLRRIEGSN